MCHSWVRCYQLRGPPEGYTGTLYCLHNAAVNLNLLQNKRFTFKQELNLAVLIQIFVIPGSHIGNNMDKSQNNYAVGKNGFLSLVTPNIPRLPSSFREKAKVLGMSYKALHGLALKLPFLSPHPTPHGLFAILRHTRYTPGDFNILPA